jgi:hypothetical protein
MRPYAIVTPALFWAEHVGRQLRTLGRDHQVLALYLWTAPTSNQYGLYYLPMDQLCAEAGFTANGANKVLESLAALEFAFYHRSEQWVWVKTLAQSSLMPTGKLLPKTDNRIKGLHSWYGTVPDNPYLAPFFDHYDRAFYLPERREWSRSQHVEVTIEPTLELASGEAPRRQLATVSASASEGSLFPDIRPATALVPVARGPRAVAKRSADYDPLFIEWFSHYPEHKQIEKRDAYQAWVKIRPKPDQEWTERAIATLQRQRQSRDWIKEGGRFVPKPVNYLEKGKYDDVVRETRYLSEDDVDRVSSSIGWGSRRDDDDPDS